MKAIDKEDKYTLTRCHLEQHYGLYLTEEQLSDLVDHVSVDEGFLQDEDVEKIGMKAFYVGMVTVPAVLFLIWGVLEVLEYIIT